MKQQAIPFLLLIGMAIACQPAPESTEILEGPEYSAEIHEIIDQHNAEVVEAYRTGNITAAAVHFAENCIQMPPNSPALRGKQSFIDAWTQNLAFGTWDFSLEAQEVRAVGDMAVELGTYTLRFSPNDSSPIPAMEDYGNYVVVWQKIDGDWKILWDAPVSEVPMPMPDSSSMPVFEE